MTVRELAAALAAMPESAQDLPVESHCGDPFEDFEVHVVVVRPDMVVFQPRGPDDDHLQYKTRRA